MNRAELADTIVSGIQYAAERLRQLSDDLFDADVSPSLSDYESPSQCRCTARLVRLRAATLSAIVAELHEHAGMLEAFSYMPEGVAGGDRQTAPVITQNSGIPAGSASKDAIGRSPDAEPAPRTGVARSALPDALHDLDTARANACEAWRTRDDDKRADYAMQVVTSIERAQAEIRDALGSLGTAVTP